MLSCDSPRLLPVSQVAVCGRNAVRSRFDVLIQTLTNDGDDGDRIYAIDNIVCYL